MTSAAKNIAQILAGEGEANPVQFLVIGISGAGILIVGIVLFWVSRKALKKVKQRQADMETETAEEGEEALDLEELYDAEDADTVLDLDLGSDEEEWDDLEMGMALGVASYAGTQPELEKGSYGLEEEEEREEEKEEEEEAVLLRSVASGEQLSEMEAHSAMVSVSSGEHLADMDQPGMAVAQRLPVQCGDHEGEVELEVVDPARAAAHGPGAAGKAASGVEKQPQPHEGPEAVVELEGIGLAPPRSAVVRRTSTEVKAELKAIQGKGDSTENVAAAAQGFSVLPASHAVLDDLEMFADDEDSEAMLDEEDLAHGHEAKKGAFKMLQHAVKKKLAAPARRASEASLVMDLTADEDIV